MKRFITILLVLTLIVFSAIGCENKKKDEPKKEPEKKVEKKADEKAAEDKKETKKFNVVATATMHRDLAQVIGGDKVEVQGIMPPGVDPHLYKPTAGDIEKVTKADMVVYNGLHFEGKMIDLLEGLEGKGKVVANCSKGLKKEEILPFEDSNVGDPHIWNSTVNWEKAAEQVYLAYVKLDEANKDYYKKNYEDYVKQLKDLKVWVDTEVAKIPKKARVLITAHDAFAYLAKDYGFTVKGVQGISTESEASTKDISDLAQFIIDNKVKAMFIESSVPKKNIEAVQEAVKQKGFDIKIAGELYSDSLGEKGSDADTYIKMMKKNMETIINGLK